MARCSVAFAGWLTILGGATGCASAGPSRRLADGVITGRVFVLTSEGRRPYKGSAEVYCDGPGGTFTRSEPGTGKYRCVTLRDQPYIIRARAHPWAPGATRTISSAGGVDVELTQVGRMQASLFSGPSMVQAAASIEVGVTTQSDSVAAPVGVFEERVRVASPEERQLLCETARWAEHAEAIQIACAPAVP